MTSGFLRYRLARLDPRAVVRPPADCPIRWIIPTCISEPARWPEPSPDELQAVERTLQAEGIPRRRPLIWGGSVAETVAMAQRRPL